jgi:DNA repair protein RadC
MPSPFVVQEDIRQASTPDLLRLLFGSKIPIDLIEPGALRALLERAPKTAVERRLHAGAELGRRVAHETQVIGHPLTSPRETREFLVRHFFGHPAEVFSVIFVDNRHRIRAIDDLFRGTIDGATVHPREVVRRAIERNAAAVILAHNHPSGVAEPSQADELITLRLRDALALVDIRLLDHLIVAGPTTISLAERGVL